MVDRLNIDSAKIDAVCNFISEQSGCPLAKIKPDSRLEEDLGIVGDDHVELLDRYFEIFSVSPGDFSYDRYCSPEGLGTSWLRKMIGKPIPKSAREPLTVSMLAAAATQGVWDSAKLRDLGVH